MQVIDDYLAAHTSKDTTHMATQNGNGHRGGFPGRGGWNYNPNTGGDTSVDSWNYVAQEGFQVVFGNAMAFYGGSTKWQPRLDLEPIDPTVFQR